MEWSCHDTRILVTQSFTKLVVDVLNLIWGYEVKFIQRQHSFPSNDLPTNMSGERKHVNGDIQAEFCTQSSFLWWENKNEQKHFILWVIEFLLNKRKDCRNHIFGKNLTDDSKSHAHLNQVCALEILKEKKKPQNTLTSPFQTPRNKCRKNLKSTFNTVLTRRRSSSWLSFRNRDTAR